MTEETELRIPFDYLTRLTFTCTGCQAEVTIDLSSPKHRRVEDYKERAPMKCAVCGATFDSQLQDSFTNLFSWREKVSKSGHLVFFRIKRS